MDKQQKIERVANLLQEANLLLQEVMGDMAAIEDFAEYRRAKIHFVVPSGKGEQK